MKFKPSGIAIIAMLFIALSACKKDDKETKNFFKYNNKETLIGTVYGGHLGESSTSGVYGTFLYIMEKTITLHQNSFTGDSLSGTGDIMILTFLSNDPASLKPGEYTYSVSSDPFIANTFGYQSGLLVNYNTSSIDPPTGLDLGGGKITVKKNGEDYEFTFNINTNVHSVITGYYKGKIIFADLTGGKKSSERNPFANRLLQ